MENDSTKFFIWTKGQQLQLSPHFNSEEFACHCRFTSCHIQKVSQDLVQKLERVRQALGTPVVVTSGYRCQAYQEDLASRGFETAVNSQHLLGKAADIQAPNMIRLKEEMAKEFLALGIALTFIHGDLRADKVRRWYYKGVKPDATT